MKNCVLILEDIRSVENTGSIFRTAEGLGAEKIILVGTTPAPIDRFGRKRKDFTKVALGSEEMMAWEHADSVDEAIQSLRAQGFQIISLEQTDTSQDIKEFEAQDKFALIVGNEVSGVSKTALELSEKIVEISMAGKKESFNVSVAAGIALFMLI